SGWHSVFYKLLLRVNRYTGRCNGFTFFFKSRKVYDVISHNTLVINHPVRSFDESEFINPSEDSKGRNQSDVRSFRCLNRTNSAVMSRVNVSDFKASS